MYKNDRGLTEYNFKQSVFESLKHQRNDIEYWIARELYPYLGYTKWINFENAIEKAKISCAKVGLEVGNHFADVSKMITLGKNAKRDVGDIALSRFACYLIAQNADPRIKEVAEAQRYFAVQTHKQEQFEQLTETQQRLILRDKVKDYNKDLFDTAKNVGVVQYGTFYDAGLKGLYGGIGSKDIKAKKGIGINKKEELLDCISGEELALNAVRITQTNAKLKRENIKGELNAVDTHYEIGKNVRNFVKDINGTMPENLPREPSIKGLKEKTIKQLPKPML
jgi:DNA-damage-inducible protein D